MKQISKCKRPNETRGDKTRTKTKPKAQEKYPVSISILRSLRRFYWGHSGHSGGSTEVRRFYWGHSSWGHSGGSTLLHLSIKQCVTLLPLKFLYA